MAGAEGGDEGLPALAALLRPLPAAGRAAPPRVSSPPPRRGSGVVMLSSDSEDEAEDSNEWTEEPNLLVLLGLEEFLSMVRNYKQALVDLQLCTRVQVTFFESWEELGEFATMFTKAVAEAPFKREQQNTGFSFYLENKWCRGVKVDHSGKGLFEVWKRQIQQFNRVSGEMAEAVVSAYPSPQLLVQAYSRCSSEQERENMLAAIPVRRGTGVTATCRRVGPELSRRIYLQMTSHDPDLYLDVTG
uniref:Essential meiotic structure-specific endonuclease 1 n=1 Tax=Phasianus colchicus TaxID=9054 RepID=A0A669Q7L6_PHACC